MLPAVLAALAAAASVWAVMLERTRRKHVRAIAQSTVRARIGHALAEGLIAGEAVDGNLRMLLPDHADWCILHLADAGKVRRVGVVHVDPDVERQMREAFDKLPFIADGRSGAPHVIRTGEPELAHVVTTAAREA